MLCFSGKECSEFPKKVLVLIGILMYYQFLLCLFPPLSIFTVSHNFVHGMDQDLNIKMSVNTFCQSHGSGVSNDFLDGGVIAVFVVVMYT